MITRKFGLSRLTALVLALLLLFLTACHTEPTPTDSSSIPEGMVPYNITVKTEGGMLLPDVTVTLSDESGKQVATTHTDSQGLAFFPMEPGIYTVTVSDLKPGFSAPTEPIKTAANGGMMTVSIHTAVITEADPNPNRVYELGEVLYDFTFRSDGTEITLHELLQTKKLVVLNFWATWCGPCKMEFPAIQAAYEEYGDSVEIIAMSISDSASVCESFRSENGYTFPMLPNFGLYEKFQPYGNGGIPFSLFIDRYGMFVNYIAGADDSVDSWRTEFAGYTADSYVQNPGKPISSDPGAENPDAELEKPDVSMPASAEIEAAVNGAGFSATYTGPTSDTVWPWVLSEDKKSIQPANIGKKSSGATISTELTLRAGQVIAFDFIASIEKDSASIYEYDLFSVYMDGHLLTKFNGSHPDWETCYVYTPTTDGTHTLTLYYGKDESDMYLPGNREYLNVRNIRTLSVSEMTAAGGSLNVYRAAATDMNTAENPKTSYLHYADVVLNKNDGYYHVGSADGPLLLCDLMYGTAWSPESINNLAFAGYLTIDGVDYSERITEYTWLQTHCELGYCAVDTRLADMLDLIVSSLGNGPDHEWEWLELCCYFDHYGAGSGITDIFDVCQGISVNSAFPAQLGTNHVVMNQVLVPRGLYYAFTPEKSGVYTFYSVDYGPNPEDQIDTYGWFVIPDGTIRGSYVDENDFIANDENFHLYHYCEAGKTYCVVVAFNAPDTLGEFDFLIEYVGDSYDEFINCTRHYVRPEEGELEVDRMYNLHAALGADGYYHQILSYDANGEPVLDLSEHGYIYVDFAGISIFMGYLTYGEEYITLKDYIEMNGILPDFGFDFTNRVDVNGNSLASLGNHQKEMEAYLALAMQATGVEHGFAKADQKLVEILENTLIRLYGESNSDKPVADQWLMFCNYYRHH